MENEGLEKLVNLLKKMKEKTEELLNEQFGHVCEWDERPPEVTVIDAPCHCGARVICSKAIEEAEPLHIIKEEQLVHLQGLVILNKTDTRLDGVFSGCIAGTEKTECTIGDGTGIVDNEWKGAGETFDEGEGKDEITKENAYMICERGGVIHFLEISEELGEVIKKMDEKVREPDLVIDWLKLYRTPTVPFPGRSVPKHKDADNYDWGMEEELNGKDEEWFITESPVYKEITGNGGTFSAVMTENNLYADAEGRYWVAVGPNVINPDHPTEKVNHSIPAEDMDYGTKLDIVVEDENQNIYYIPAVVGDAKEHSYPDGMYQTGEAFDTNRSKVFTQNKNSVEFIGYNIAQKVYEDGIERSSVNITNNFKLKEIIVYDGVFNYE